MPAFVPGSLRIVKQRSPCVARCRYELSDGSARSEQAVLQGAGTPDEFLLVTGSFRWTSPDGQVTQVDYTADNTGYHPVVKTQGGGGGGFGIPSALAASLVG